MAFTTIPWNLLGHRVIGDLAGFTCYTDKRGRKIFYEKAPPDKPATPAQRLQRNKFRDCVLAWKSLSDAEKFALEEAVRKTHLCLTGQNLFVSCSLMQKPRVYETVARQSNEILPPLHVI